MITFGTTTDDCATVTIDIAGEKVTFYRKARNATNASMLARAARCFVRDRIEAVRKAEYEEGWKDKASKKRPKQKYFHCGL